MATHPIGHNKVIIGVPVDDVVARKLGRQAFEFDVSKAEIVRRLLEGYLAGEIPLPKKRRARR